MALAQNFQFCKNFSKNAKILQNWPIFTPFWGFNWAPLAQGAQLKPKWAKNGPTLAQNF